MMSKTILLDSAAAAAVLEGICLIPHSTTIMVCMIIALYARERNRDRRRDVFLVSSFSPICSRTRDRRKEEREDDAARRWVLQICHGSRVDCIRSMSRVSLRLGVCIPLGCKSQKIGSNREIWSRQAKEQKYNVNPSIVMQCP